MRLFHTSDRIIKKPDLNAGRSNADFGQGFYLTPDESFAGSWARERTSSDIYVNVYELDESELRVKSFTHESAWFNYIYENRNGRPDSLKGYDVIMGPVANDTLFETYGIITSGFLSEEQALELLDIGPEFTQLAVKTDAALSRLEWKDAYVLSSSDIETARSRYKEESEEFSMEFARKLDSYDNGMQEKDHIVRATAANETVRAFAIRSTDLTAEAREIHHTYPVVTAALGRLLSAGAMMGSMMKGENDKLTLQIKGDGPIGQMTVTADSHGNIKGFPANPCVDIPAKSKGKLDVGGAVGRGILTVVMDLGLKEPYNGHVELQTGEIGDDLAYYYTVSEQTPSAVGLGVMVDTDSSVKHAGGFIIQIMPDAEERTISAIEEKLASAEPITTMMDKGMSPEDILEYYLGDIGLKITETLPVRYHCGCTKDKVAGALATISTEDLEEIINDGEEIEVKCYFCNSAYKFSVDELKAIASER